MEEQVAANNNPWIIVLVALMPSLVAGLRYLWRTVWPLILLRMEQRHRERLAALTGKVDRAVPHIDPKLLEEEKDSPKERKVGSR